MDESIDLNINNYTQDDLISLIGLSTEEDREVTYDDIVNASEPLIKRFMAENNYDLSSFFQQVQLKLLEDIDGDNSNDDLLKQSNNQIGHLYQNEYPTLKDINPTQYDKITQRKQQVNVFGQNDKFVMNKHQLGISNTYQVPVVQDQLNPNLKNTITRIINIDSNYRDNIIPYTPDPDGPSSPTNFTLDLSDPIFKTISIQLTSYTIPFTWYSIDCYQSNNCFFVDSSMVIIPSGNYTPIELVEEISGNLIFTAAGLNITYNSNTGKITITNNSVNDHTITFFDPAGIKVCDSSCNLNGRGSGSKTSAKFNNNLGWILGFRGNTSIPTTSTLYGQLVYDILISSDITSESIVDTYGPKYFLLVLDDFNQNHLNKGLIGITPTQKYAEIPSYWNEGLQLADGGCTIPENTYKKVATYVQNSPRRLTQAQLYTLNQTTLARAQTNKSFLTTPTTTDVLALIPLRKKGVAFGDQIVDDFNLDNADRVYFGPIDIERMRIRLVDDKGYTVNLNGSNWSFTLTATSLYQY